MMMHIRPRILITTAVQAAFLKALANITVQVATAWKLGFGAGYGDMDWGRVAEFFFYGFCSASLGFPWQHLLEHHFPTQTTTAGNPAVSSRAVVTNEHDGHDPEKRPDMPRKGSPPPTSAPLLTMAAAPASPTAINWVNVFYKLVLDQTLWLLFTTSLFLFVTNVLRVPSLDALYGVWTEKTWYIIKAAWHVWPLVAILNFAFVPVDLRVLVAACVGFAWNVFLSLITLTNAPPTTPK